ncbi:hypothetical protein SBADM41S_00257 [Streptomyces badius]
MASGKGSLETGSRCGASAPAGGRTGPVPGDLPHEVGHALAEVLQCRPQAVQPGQTRDGRDIAARRRSRRPTACAAPDAPGRASIAGVRRITHPQPQAGWRPGRGGPRPDSATQPAAVMYSRTPQLRPRAARPLNFATRPP